MLLSSDFSLLLFLSSSGAAGAEYHQKILSKNTVSKVTVPEVTVCRSTDHGATDDVPVIRQQINGRGWCGIMPSPKHLPKTNSKKALPERFLPKYDLKKEVRKRDSDFFSYFFL